LKELAKKLGPVLAGGLAGFVGKLALEFIDEWAESLIDDLLDSLGIT